LNVLHNASLIINHQFSVGENGIMQVLVFDSKGDRIKQIKYDWGPLEVVDILNWYKKRTNNSSLHVEEDDIVIVHVGKQYEKPTNSQKKQYDSERFSTLVNKNIICFSGKKPTIHAFTGGMSINYDHINALKKLSAVSVYTGKFPSKIDILGINMLLVLSILCQGYLATHSQKPSSPKQAQASDKMGQIEKGSGKESEQPEWWQGVLGQEKDIVLKKLTSEWGNKELPSEIIQLVDAIYDTSIKENQSVAELVAGSYLQISEKLNG